MFIDLWNADESQNIDVFYNFIQSDILQNKDYIEIIPLIKNCISAYELKNGKNSLYKHAHRLNVLEKQLSMFNLCQINNNINNNNF